jgi:hypothetical protein
MGFPNHSNDVNTAKSFEEMAAMEEAAEAEVNNAPETEAKPE